MADNTELDGIHKSDALIFGLSKALFAAADPQFVEEFGLSIDEVDGLMLTSARRIPHPYLNNIGGLGLDEPVTREQVDALVADHPGKMIVLSRFAEPAEIRDWLRAHGYMHPFSGTYHTYVSDPEAGNPAKTPQTSLRIERLSADKGSDFTKVCTQVGLLSDLAVFAGVEQQRIAPWLAGLAAQPDCYVYVAYDDEMPVATGVLFTLNQTAWLAFASTLPSHRGMGAQSAIIARRVQDALDMGCREIFVATGASVEDEAANAHHTSVSNLHQLGFRVLSKLEFWIRMPASH